MYVHAIFHVKNNECLIRLEDEKELYAYVGGVIKLSHSVPIMINGMDNHLHVLCILSKNISLSSFMEEIKTDSSRWIKTLGPHYRQFAWQGGYAGYSVSHSRVEAVKKYIMNQKEHHKKQTFQDEYIQFLKENDVEYNGDYLWT
jgi:REP element-mobilizing transposase RayT